MRVVSFCICIFLITSACNKTITGDNSTDQSTSASTMMDVSYGSNAQQKMDVYLPANRATDSTKLVVFIHGGAWNEGDKTDFNSYVTVLQSKLPGYAIANLNYRLATGSQNLFPTQENDVKAALDFLYSKRTDYKISSNWVLLGASAGGQLALLQAYKYTSPVKPKAVVSFFGPTDLTALFNSNPLIGAALAGVVGWTPATNASIYQQSSPINYVTAQSPPTLILQGGADPLVPVTQSTTLRDKLLSAGVSTQYVFYPTEGHGWEGTNLTDSFEKVAAFIKLYSN